jgi:hypothetical protein
MSDTPKPGAAGAPVVEHVYGPGCTAGYHAECGMWHCMAHIVGRDLNRLSDCPLNNPSSPVGKMLAERASRAEGPATTADPCCEIGASGRVCEHLGAEMLAQIAKFRDAGEPIEVAIGYALDRLDRTPPLRATPDHIQRVRATPEQIEAFNASKPGAEWVLYFDADGGGTAQTFVRMWHFPGTPGQPLPAPTAPAFALLLALAGCTPPRSAADPRPRDSATPPVVTAAPPAPLLLARIDAIADRVDALEANRSLSLECARACPHGVETVRTLGAEVACRCRWPRDGRPRHHRRAR